MNSYIETPSFYPEGWFVAVDVERINGWSAVLPHKNRPDTMVTGITVIDRPYRRKGLATAMKRKTFDYMKALGYGKLKRPMPRPTQCAA